MGGKRQCTGEDVRFVAEATDPERWSRTKEVLLPRRREENGKEQDVCVLVWAPNLSRMGACRSL
jgi:hypothetical protein